MPIDRPWTLLWEAPTALASWGFYRSVRAVIGRLYRDYLERNPDTSQYWRILSGETLRQPLSLPVLMTTGPRWNTHAVIGTLGPFNVQQQLSLDLATIRESAPSWVLVIYHYPDYATVHSLDSVQTTESGDCMDLSLPLGRYTLGLRYYLSGDRPTFPAVSVDGQSLCPPETAPDQPNAFYGTLTERSNPFYRALHDYIYVLLRWRPYLSEAWVRREFLPVGAPDTRFLFDYVCRGDQLQILLEPALLTENLVFFTLYSRASFPIASQQLTLAKAEFVCPQDGFYALRIRPLTCAAAAQINQWLVLQGHEPGKTSIQLGTVGRCTASSTPPAPDSPLLSGQP